MTSRRAQHGVESVGAGFLAVLAKALAEIEIAF
jgi:hypothetical protein